MNDQKHVIWGGVAIIAVVFTSFVVLLIFHVDPAPLTAVIASVVVPIISAVYLVGQIRVVRDKVDSVDTKVNGHLDKLTDKIPDRPASTEDTVSP
jgi:hypothetical protein